MGPLLRRWLAPSPQSQESCWLLVADGSWFPPTMTSSDAACVCVEQAVVQRDAFSAGSFCGSFLLF